MGKNKDPLSVFITDNGVAIYGGSMAKKEAIVQAQHSLASGVIDNGYIKEPELLYGQLKQLFNILNIQPRHVRLIIQDQNVIVREMRIKKKDLQNKTISEYAYERIGIDFHVPFKSVILSHQVRATIEDTYYVLLYLTDQDLLHDYYDVLERLGVKHVVFDLAVTALLEVASQDYSFKDENIMMVSLYDEQISIQIIEEEKLIFGVVEDCDGHKEDLPLQFEMYCERVANYYQYNLRKNKQTISRILVFNLSDFLEFDDVSKELLPRLKHLNATLFTLESEDSIFESHPKGRLVPYASNQISLKHDQDENRIDFQLTRFNKTRTLSYYVIILAMVIFASVAVVFIPYNQNQEAILKQRFVNETLNTTITNLRRTEQVVPSPIVVDFQASYLLIEQYQQHMPIMQFEDLQSALLENMDMTNAVFNVGHKTIVLTISAESTADCLDYILLIYELFGISEQTTHLNQWMIRPPSAVFISSTMMEVTIHYA